MPSDELAPPEVLDRGVPEDEPVEPLPLTELDPELPEPARYSESEILPSLSESIRVKFWLPCAPLSPLGLELLPEPFEYVLPLLLPPVPEPVDPVEEPGVLELVLLEGS